MQNRKRPDTLKSLENIRRKPAATFRPVSFGGYVERVHTHTHTRCRRPLISLQTRSHAQQQQQQQRHRGVTVRSHTRYDSREATRYRRRGDGDAWYTAISNISPRTVLYYVRIGWQWRNLVPYLCQLAFGAILWVKLWEILAAVISIK